MAVWVDAEKLNSDFEMMVRQLLGQLLIIKISGILTVMIMIVIVRWKKNDLRLTVSPIVVVALICFSAFVMPLDIFNGIVMHICHILLIGYEFNFILVDVWIIFSNLYLDI